MRSYDSKIKLPPTTTLPLHFTSLPPDLTSSNNFISRLMSHLTVCMDVTPYYGTNIIAVPTMSNNTWTGTIEVRKLSPPKDHHTEFDYDPFWDEEVTGSFTPSVAPPSFSLDGPVTEPGRRTSDDPNDGGGGAENLNIPPPPLSPPPRSSPTPKPGSNPS